MGTRQDLVGRRFGRLTVVGFSESRTSTGGNTHPYWECLCDCGKTHVAAAYNLRKGAVRSCGCLLKENNQQFKHGGCYTTEYKIWSGMLYRIRSNHPDYGGRGITICDRWLGENGFQNFLEDMGPRPSSDHSLDRIDVDGSYSPTNCRWATRQEQQRNRRSNIVITASGKTQTAIEWAEELGIKRHTLYKRKEMGWSDHEIINTPVGKPRTTRLDLQE